MIELTGPQKQKLREAMISSYPDPQVLARLTNDQFSLNLAVVAGGNAGIEHQAFELISWMEARGRLGELLMGGRAQNPGNPKILGFLRSLRLTADEAITGPQLESVIGKNTQFHDVAAWRATLDRREYQVGRVEKGGKARGTAFLVGPDLVLTNEHVIRSALTEGPKGWAVRFDYKSMDGVAVSPGMTIAFHADWLLDHAPPSPIDTQPNELRNGQEPSDDQLDFALVRLVQSVGDESVRGLSQTARGWIDLPTAAVDWNDVSTICILQHPSGDPLKLALGAPANLSANSTGNRVLHTAPTKPGSSGSPVFDGEWNLIALHHAGDPSELIRNNEAIPIHLVAARPSVKAALP